MPRKKSESGTVAVSPRRRPTRGLAERLAFEEFLTALSRAFVAAAPAAVDGEIERWLRRLVELVGADRVSIIQQSPGETVLQLTHSYSVEGVPPFPKVVLDTHYPWYVEQVRQGRTLRLERALDDLPLEAVAERERARRTGLKSHLMLPFTVAGRPLGALVFACFRAHRTWPDDLVGRLGLVAEVFANALARKQAWQLLEKRLSFERFLADLSTAFTGVASTQVDAEIERWLRRLVEFLDVDTAGLVQMSPDEKALELTHSYALEGVPPPPKIILDTQFAWYVAQVRQGRTLRFERLPDGLPPEAVSEHAYVVDTGFKSHLAFPLIVGGTIVGQMGFGCFRAYRTWPDNLVKRLEQVAQVFANALARKRARRALEERIAFERLIAELVKTLVNVPADELDAQIRSGLGSLVEHLGVERSSLARFSGDGESLTVVQWAGAAGMPAPTPPDEYPWLKEQLRRGRTIFLRRVPDDLPAKAVAEREKFPRVGIRSLLSIPLMAGGRAWGFIGLGAFRHPREWTPEEMQRLRLVGEIMMEAIRRRESEEAARRRRDELAHVARIAALGELTAALAHELNQPLAAIQANVQATRRILASGQPPDELDEILRDVGGDARRAGDLIRHLRHLLRPRELEKIPLDLNQVLREVQPIARADAARHGARLVFELARVLPQIPGDPVQLQQVLLNLVRNAAEAMAGDPPDAREVIVQTASSPPDRVMVSVEDTGPPIDDAAFDGLFTPFHTTKPEGLGMGLAISRSIVEAHGGRLWAERRPERGLAVRFTLPTGIEGGP